MPVSVREKIFKAMDEVKNASEAVVFARYSTVEERRQAEYAASELMRLSPRLIELVTERRIQSLGVEVQR